MCNQNRRTMTQKKKPTPEQIQDGFFILVKDGKNGFAMLGTDLITEAEYEA